MQELFKKFNELKKQLRMTEPICLGSINTVYTKCGNDYCECFKDKKKRHGPYFLWTRKKNGKTISKRLSKKQVNICRKFINNYTKLKKIIDKMLDISVNIVENKDKI